MSSEESNYFDSGSDAESNYSDSSPNEEKQRFLEDVVKYVKGEHLIAKTEDKIETLDDLQVQLEKRIIAYFNKSDSDHVTIKNKCKLSKAVEITRSPISEEMIRKCVECQVSMYPSLDLESEDFVNGVMMDIDDMRKKERKEYLKQTFTE